ncbi:hypothetical protein L3Q82_015218, partial [Scortum barcoo]
WIFNLSLQIGRVPTLWKTSRIVPVPKKNRPSELNDFRPVALTSHLMKTLERLFLSLLRPQVQHAQDRLQFAYQPGVGVEDAILYLLHRAHSHLDKGSGTVRILFLDFSSAFNTIQPTLLRDKLKQDGSGPPADGLDLRLPHWQITYAKWGGSISKKDTSRLDKLIRRAGSVVGMKLDSLVMVAESRTLDKLLDIMDNASHPLHSVISNQRSLFSERLLLPKCRTNMLKNSVCPSCHHTLQLLTW